MKTDGCPRCGDPIIRAVTEDGRLIEVNAAITPSGVYVLQAHQDPRLPPLAHLAEGKWAGRPARAGHATTCRRPE